MNRSKGWLLAAVLLGGAIDPIGGAAALAQGRDEPAAIIPHGQDRPPEPAAIAGRGGPAR